MGKRFSILYIFLLLPLSLSGFKSEKAEITVLSSTLSETVLEIKCPSLLEEKDGIYKMGELEVLEREDFPDLPYITGIIGVSDKGSFKGYVEAIDEYSITIDNSMQFTDYEYPENQLSLDTPQILRDYRIVRFQFFPIRYIPKTGEIRVTKNARIRIRRTTLNGVNEKQFHRKSISSAFYDIYKNSFLNYGSIERYSSDSVLYVVITPDTYYDALLPFTEWKEETGIITKMVKFSEISANPTQYDIRNYMLAAYTTWPHPPDYFLAVGDAGVFPVMYTNGYANDNFYVALDSINDIFPDILGGRLSINNEFELNTVINKVINYEKSPYMAETTWYKKAIMIASDEYPSQAETKRWVRDRFIEAGYTYVDSLYAENYSSSYQLRNDITNAVNEGRGFLNYRGPGWDSYWYSPYIGTIFDVSNIQVLNNGRKVPVVTSCGCGVAKFDVYTCFGEQWLRNGTPTSEKGAVSFFGPTYITHTKHNNKLDKGIYKGIFQEGLTSFGEATVRGKIYMYEICGMSDTTIKEMNEYLILGDPTLLMRTDVPESIVVSHDSLVPIGESVLWVLVRDKHGPVTNAFVCAKMDTAMHSGGRTDSTGAVGLTIFVTTVDTIFISVVSQNHFPYYGHCLVNANGPWPGYNKHYVDDDTLGTSYGNNDGIPNEGEKIELPVILKNYGNQAVNGIFAIVSSDDNWIGITDSIEQFGNIPAGDSVISQDDYDLTVSPSTPDNHIVLLRLDVHDSNDSVWVSHFEITISTPVLSLLSFTVDDSGMANANGILDPGEIGKLYCRLKNKGSAKASGVSAKLRTLNQYVECIDSTSTYGDLLPGEESEGTSFTVEVDSLTPTGTDANMRLIFSSSEGYTDSTEFIIKIGIGGDFFIWDADENLSSGVKIKTALEAAGYIGDYSTNIGDYLEILKAFKAVFICLGVYPSNYVLSNGQIVDSLCSFLNSGGRIYMEGADTWKYDSPTNLHPYFKILGIEDGSNDTYTINGVSGTFTNQMSFTYAGDNNWMDHLGITGGSFVVFNNVSPPYINGIAYDGGGYKTVGTSFEFGGLADGSPPSTKQILADSIMRFFGITGIHEKVEHPGYPSVLSLSKSYPNPFSRKTTFTYSVPLLEGEKTTVKKKIVLAIYDIAGRQVRILFSGRMNPGVFKLSWDGKNNFGKKVSYGIYFARLSIENEEASRTQKLVFLR